MGTNSEINQNIIFFDGVCNLCNGAVNFVIDRDAKSQFRFSALQSEFAKNKLSSSGIDPGQLDTIILMQNDGSIKTKSSAALHIAKKLSGLWPLLFAFIILPKFFRDWVYDIVARYRYRWFGQADQCRMPTPELTRRFILDS